jgi:5'-nucleotidase
MKRIVAAAAAAPGQVTYGELFSVQPLNNVMTVQTMTGDQIFRLLAQQFNNPLGGQLRMLQISSSMRYSYSYDAATQKGTITPGSVMINGVPVQPNQTYRVAMNSFLATGGDGFTVFNEGTDQLGGEIDLDALVSYFMKNSPVMPGAQNRITRTP